MGFFKRLSLFVFALAGLAALAALVAPWYHVRVHARVQPASTVDVLLAASELHERLEEGLAVIVGDNVDKIDLEFVNAAEYAPAAEAAAFGEQDAADADAVASAPARTAAPAPSDTSEITVPMGRSAAEREDDNETMGEE